MNNGWSLLHKLCSLLLRPITLLGAIDADSHFECKSFLYMYEQWWLSVSTVEISRNLELLNSEGLHTWKTAVQPLAFLQSQ